jgi:hypothetical protein
VTDSVKFLLNLAGIVVGSGVGAAAIGAYLGKRFNTQLEIQRALLQRTSKIHERQVDALLFLHSKLELALFYLQRAAAAGKLAGEPDDQELLRRMSQEFAEASDCFSKNKLLMSPELMRRIDEFFSKMLSAGIDLSLTFEPGMQSGPRAQLWDQARTTAYKDLPSILEAIRTEARAAIHG